MSKRENCNRWLDEAQSLNSRVDKLSTDVDFLNNAYDARNNPGFIKHAYVLSFYHLLRFKSIDQTNTSQVKSFYKKAIKETI